MSADPEDFEMVMAQVERGWEREMKRVREEERERVLLTVETELDAFSMSVSPYYPLASKLREVIRLLRGEPKEPK